MELAAAVVQALTEQLIQGVGKEAHFALDLRAHLGQTKQILEEAKKFLDNKDIMKLKIEEEHVKPALIQLRRLIYEADDVVTDCIINEESSFLSRHNPLFLHKAGKKLKNINSAMQQELQKLGAYSMNNTPQSQPHTQGDPKSENDERIMASQNYNPHKIIGLDEDIKKIKGWMIEPNLELQCIAVAGMGGLGKTTVAQQIYNDSEVGKRFQTVWVTVSKNFSTYKISTYVLKKLGGEIPEESDSNNLLNALKKARSKKDADYLFVLDDVWSISDTDWWTKFRSALSREGRSTCIMVTTRDEGVAREVVFEERRIHRPKVLDPDQSWLLFCEFAFPLTKGKCESPQFEKKGREILDKCGGLPLSIKTIGSLLASKNDKLFMWTEVSESFHRPGERLNDQVMASLRLSYDELEAQLKQCLLCLSVYPEDYEIKAEQIIHWWIAEGIVPRQGPNKTMLELGYQYLSALTSRCLVEVDRRRNYDGKVYSCKIHDMVRELIMEIAESEQFCAFNQKGIQKWREDSYWLGFVDEMIKEITSFGNNSRLRSLVLVTSRPVDFNKNFGLPLSLRMLDLSSGCSNLDEKRVKNLLDWIGCLERLACLNLSELKCLEELPSSVYKLRNLQMLILTGCTKLKKLDSSISSMKRLIVLHLGGCPLEYLPRGLEKLSGLQQLTGFRVVTNSKACGLLDLSKLIELRELQIVVSNDDFEFSETELNEVLSKLKNLKALDVEANECRKPKALKMVDCLCPPRDLKELYLRKYHCKAMPKWVHPSILPKLQYLCVEDGDISSFIPQVEKARPEYIWEELEGLSLKHLGSLAGDWNEFKEVMPVGRYIEISPGYGQWKNLPTDVKQSGVWRRS